MSQEHFFMMQFLLPCSTQSRHARNCRSALALCNPTQFGSTWKHTPFPPVEIHNVVSQAINFVSCVFTVPAPSISRRRPLQHVMSAKSTQSKLVPRMKTTRKKSCVSREASCSSSRGTSRGSSPQPRKASRSPPLWRRDICGHELKKMSL